ncbi:hypothetical protein CASFOL_035267 [Castilleja foliolosa]|uniref:Photosystem II 5 kDa protein, chloroplastic n=1 Tax=Castilleja foliolosa TaxID=1961234 RepID=A0ABD3BS41_9LAMI
MASMTMTASFLGSSAAKNLPTTSRRGLVAVRASRDSEEKMVVSNAAKVEESSNGRRELMFAVAAAAACSVAKVAMADDEPKRGTPEAKKKYGPICVTMPTARICRN